MKRTKRHDPCPGCGITSGYAGGPHVGDYAVCLGCGSLAIFGADLRRREPTCQEFEAGLENPAIMRIMAQIQKFNSKN